MKEGQPDEPQDLQAYHTLVGQQVSPFFQVKEDADLATRIDRSKLFSQVDPSDDFVPVYITGAIRLNDTKQLSPVIAPCPQWRHSSYYTPVGFPHSREERAVGSAH